jgi:pectinesterase
LIACSWLSVQASHRPAQDARRTTVAGFEPNAVVAADGSGQYKTVQDAINAAPQNTRASNRWVIFIKAGTYRELVYVQREKRFVTLIGEDPARTILTYDLSASRPGSDGLPIGTFRTPSTYIDADDFIAENLTFENSAGPVGQALALRVDGDRVIFRNCRFLGWQDTILLNRGRHYFEDSLITGHVDFIFGAATAFFERCSIHVWRDGYVTAASTPAEQPYGFVFVHSSISGEPGAHTYLGRPWRDFAQVAFITTLMSDVVRPVGWHNWDKPEREKTTRYSEFGSTGAGASRTDRVSWARQLTAAEAAALTVSQVLGGADSWDPRRTLAQPSTSKALAAPMPRAPGGDVAPATQPSSAATAVSWDQILRQSPAWYGGADAQRIAETVLLYQRAAGGWPKNLNMAAALSPADRAKVADERALNDATIDNASTTTQIRFLALVDRARADERVRAAALKGIDYLLGAQYANGGWPQYFPLRDDYSRRITFNDDAMINVMTLLRESSRGQTPFEFVDPPRRERAAQAVARGTNAILKTQIRVNGVLTGWCQQHDEGTFLPVKARAYEHPSLASKETAGIARFLMGIERPSPEIVSAIDGAVGWLRAAQLSGVRTERRTDASGSSGYDVVAVQDPNAPPIWARFYEIGTNRPMFSGRDGIIKFSLSEIEIERRTGYSWYGDYAAKLLTDEYPKWKK